jgi:transketolase
VKIVGSDPGIMAEANGGTHMPFEDMAIMRAIPNMVCFEPTDGAMLARAIPQIIDYPGAVYIRLFRKKPEHIFDDVPDFKLGKAITVKAGKDVTLVASGIMVEKALKAAEILKEEGIDAGVLNIHTWKPIDEEAIVNAVKTTGALVTCENHTLQGGLGVVSKCPAPVGMIGVNNTFGEVGKKEYLAEKFHLTVEDIVNKAKETIALKK